MRVLCLFPLLEKEGRPRRQKDAAQPPLKGADGVVRSALLFKEGKTLILLSVLCVAVTALAQQRAAPTITRPPFGDGPFKFDTAEQHKIRVVVVTKGLSHPWGLAFLPDGRILVTERAGRLRLIKDGVLDPTPIPGVPKVFAQQLSGLMDVALHPRFSENRFVYLTYTKPLEKGVTTALARGRFDGHALQDVKRTDSSSKDYVFAHHRFP